MRQSTLVKTGLPAWMTILILAVGGFDSAWAQDRYEVARRENFRREPEATGTLLASLERGTPVLLNDTRGLWLEVTVEGWVWERSLRVTDRDGFDLEIVPSAGENLRDAPNGDVLGRLRRGFLAEELERQGDWVRIQRTAWMFAQSLTRVGSAASPAPTNPVPANQASDQVGLDYAVTERTATVFREVAGDTAGAMRGGLPVRILSRAGDWVKVQTEGWVREEDLRPPDEDVLVGVSAAEVRATPRAFVGQTIQWRVQYLALKEGTGLRVLIPQGSPYMLARGPLPEASFVYAIVSEEQAGELQRVNGIAELVILGRVLGVSRFLGTPVLQMIEMQVRNP